LLLGIEVCHRLLSLAMGDALSPQRMKTMPYLRTRTRPVNRTLSARANATTTRARPRSLKSLKWDQSIGTVLPQVQTYRSFIGHFWRPMLYGRMLHG